MNKLYWSLFLLPPMIYLACCIVFSGYSSLWQELSSIGLVNYCLALVFLTVFHELLHVLGGVMSGVRPDKFSFGFDRASLSVECSCHDEMSILGYTVFLVCPFIVLTPLFLLLACLSGAHLWWIMLVLSVSGCAFDLTVLAAIVGIPRHTRVLPQFEGKNGQVYIRAASS